MVVCSNCRKREAKHQTAMNINGRLVYMSLCDQCFEDLRKESQVTESLNQFSKDLTDYAREGKLDPVIGREKEIDRVVHILSRRKKNNPVLIGEPGVGKTAIVEGLAQKLYEGSVPEPLRNKRLVSLDLAAMIAGTAHRGSFEKRLKEIIEEVIKTKGQVILFIDELHTLIGAGSAQGSMDAANILKPYLARGELQLIGATTLKEYRIIEKDAALERRFQQIMVDEPSFEHTRRILQGLRKSYEEHHQIKITNEAIDSAVKLSSRYISDKFLPDKAIDLIDEAGAALRLELASQEPENLKEVSSQIDHLEQDLLNEENSEKRREIEEKLEKDKQVKKELTELWVQTKLEKTPILDEKHVAAVVSIATGIPLSELTQDERLKLKNLKQELKKKVVGQDEPVEIVSQAIRRARAGVKQLNRPIGVFMFLGPTGIGKTQLAKALAETLYGSEDYLIRVDMSEFNERHNVARLIGSPPGYVGFEEGGQLTEKVRRKPFSIILFDEIEKAHTDVFNILLQVMDDGRMTDGHGLTVDFKNTIIIMTSNVGSEYIKQNRIGFTELNPGKLDGVEEADTAYASIKSRLEESLKSSFRPEFLNRIDDIIIFKPLKMVDIEEIVDIELKNLEVLLEESGISVKFTSKAKKYIAEAGYNIEMGARPIKRLIQREVENQVSSLIIDNEAKKGDIINIDADKNGLILEVIENSKIAVSA
jgi:ATP-dependent Clp protease ATP-binding subunit ClpC